MHLVIVWVSTIGLDGGSGVYRGLGVVRCLYGSAATCAVYLPCGAAIAVCACRMAGVWGWNPWRVCSLSLGTE